MGIREHWINLLYRAAMGTKKTRTLLTPIGIVIFGGFTCLFVVLAILVDRWFTLSWPLSPDLSWIISALLITIGVALTAWSVIHFLKVRGTPVPFNPPPELVHSGPYKYIRNPMLTGVFLFLFGVGFAIKSLSLVVLFTPAFVLVNACELKIIEEPELIKRLGDDYVTYRQSTPMFIPGIKFRK